MSSQIDEEEKFSDSGESKMCAHHETSSLNGAENSSCQSSGILFDSSDVGVDPRDESGSPREKPQTEPATEAISRQQADGTQGPKDGDFDSVLYDGHCSRSNNGNRLVNENAFHTEDPLQSLVPVEFESSRQCAIKEQNHFLTLDNNETRSALESSGESSVRPQPEILLQPRSLRAEYSRNESISRAGSWPDFGADSPLTARLTRPTGAEKHSSPTAGYGSAKLGAHRTWSVRFVKPTSTRGNSNPDRGRENRDIFENGGEQQSWRLPAGASYVVGSEEIERLSLGDSPEPRVAISRSQSPEEEQPNVGLLNLLKECSLGCLRFIAACFQRICKQFLKAPIFYTSSTLVIIASVHVWDRIEEDRDVPLLVILSFSTFVGMTFLFDRGQFSHVIGRCGACVPECRRGCGRGDPCIPLCCCGRQSPEPPQSSRRHSQYRHLEEDGAFRHEIADISKLNPKDCPQIKMVVQRERVHSESPDYPPEVSQVSADVHVLKRDGQKLGATRKRLGGRAAADVQGMKERKTRSDSSHSRHTKTFQADIHAPDREASLQELSSIRETERENCVQNGDPEKSDEGVFKKFSECSPQTLPRFAKSARRSDTSSDHDYFRSKGGRLTPPEDESWLVHATGEAPEAGEFVCEHYGQAVACSCATFFQKVE